MLSLDISMDGRLPDLYYSFASVEHLSFSPKYIKFRDPSPLSNLSYSLPDFQAQNNNQS